jgi:hypothetical protein
MGASDAASRAAPYLQRLVENEYVQDNLSDAFGSLRAAYGRASGRKAVDAADDKKLRRQVRDAAGSLREAAIALKTGRKKPKKKRGRLLLLLVAGGAAAALAVNEGLRKRAMGAIPGAEATTDDAGPSGPGATT